MSSNPYKRLRGLLPAPALEYGVVQSADAGGVVVELPDGALVRVRGEGTVGDAVFIRGGAIDGPAPALDVVVIEL